MKRILIVKLWALGDILMATPVLRALKRQWPDCHITWIVDKGNVSVLQGNPLIDDLYACDSHAWRHAFRCGRWVSYARLIRALRRDLHRRRFDVVLNLTPEKWWSVWFNVAPQRVGLFPDCRPGLLGISYTQVIPRQRTSPSHNTRHYLRPAQALGIPGPYDERMVLAVSRADRQAARVFLEEAGYDGCRPLLLLHPGTSQASKCWPPEHYAAVAASLADRCMVVITGSPGERPLADAILDVLPVGASRPLVAAGRLGGILQTAALVESAAAVVTGDTSLLHITSALGTPLVAIYGSTRPGDNAPLFGPHALLFDDAVPCAPCYKARCPLVGTHHLRCQRAVTPARVLAALESLLGVPASLSVLQ